MGRRKRPDGAVHGRISAQNGKFPMNCGFLTLLERRLTERPKIVWELSLYLTRRPNRSHQDYQATVPIPISTSYKGVLRHYAHHDPYGNCRKTMHFVCETQIVSLTILTQAEGR